MKIIIGFILLCGITTFVKATTFSLNEKFLNENKVLLNHLLHQTNSKLREGSTVKATVNEFTDKLLANIDRFVNQSSLDPLALPAIDKEISYRIFPITYKGSLKLSNIDLQGLSSLNRYDDASITYSEITKIVKFDIPLAFEDFKFKCKYATKLMGIGSHGNLDGGMKDIRMKISLAIDLELLQASAEYKITHSGHISVHFHQFLPINWMLNLLANTTTTLFKSLILNVINEAVDGTLETTVDVINDIVWEITHYFDSDTLFLALDHVRP